MDILEEASALINGERQQTYGGATESFTRIAGLWSAYLGVDLTSYDAVNMLGLLKIARAKNGYHRDSYVDLAGYAALGERLFDEQLSVLPEELWASENLPKAPVVVGELTREHRDRAFVDSDGWTFTYYADGEWHAQKGAIQYKHYKEPVGVNWLNHQFTEVLQPEPRVWQNVSDIPIGTTVLDYDGDKQRRISESDFEFWQEVDNEWEKSHVATDEYGPFTEVIGG